MLITSNGEEEDDEDEDVIGILNHLVASVQGNSTQARQKVITFQDELHERHMVLQYRAGSLICMV